jgi:adenylyl-sulfate kinase
MGGKWHLFIGRWQPFHNGHLSIIRTALDDGKRVLIGIRDTERDESNPYTYEQRKEMIHGELEVDYEHGFSFDFIKIPDIASINIGRNVGYEINEMEVSEEIACISGSEIRKRMKEGDPTWKDFVPKSTADIIDESGNVIWLTGLSGSGKTTIANALSELLTVKGKKHVILDGDVMRRSISADLGFSMKDRAIHAERVARLAKELADQGHFVIVCLISPTSAIREKAKEIIGEERFFLVYVDASIEVCKERDPKGLYAKAEAGEIKGMTGIDSPYEVPEYADIVVSDYFTPVETSTIIYENLEYMEGE